MSFISSFDNISAVDLCETGEKEWQRLDPKFFLCIPASAADADAAFPKAIKTLLADGLITFFINGNSISNNAPRNLTKNPPDCFIVYN